tara:strand:- start:71 stop:313 length:243 start_codon:yes stop_codon:yes gene_type:complete
MITTNEKVFVQILYKNNTYPNLIQEFSYEGYDVSPDYPHFDDFLNYWLKNIPYHIIDIQGFCQDLKKEKVVYLPDNFLIH